MIASFVCYYKEHFGIKVFVKFLIFIFIISSSFTAFLIYNHSKTLTESLLKNGNLLVSILADNSRIGVFSENKDMLTGPAEGIFQQEAVLEASVFNLEGDLLKTLVKSELKNRQESSNEKAGSMNKIFKKLRQSKSPLYLDGRDMFEFWSSVIADSGYNEEEALLLDENLFHTNQRNIGFVKVTIDKKGLNKQITSLLYKSIMIGFVFLITGSGATYFMVKRITKPLNKLTEGVKTIGMGGAVEKVPVETMDQIGRLANAYNTMYESLERRQNELKESELKYRTIFEHTSDGISLYEQFSGNNKRRLIDCNESYAKMAGRSKDEIVPMQDIKQIQCNHKPSENANETPGNTLGGLFSEGTFSWIRPDNRENYVEYRAVTVKTGNHVFVYGIDRDITMRRKAEKQVHTLTQELIKAQETERQRISRDLHDNVAQDLSTIKIACETLFDGQAEVSSQLKQKASRISKLLHAPIMAVRDLSYNLRPPELDQLGLVRTVYQLCEDFTENNDININFFSAGLENLRLAFDAEINLYRIIQETLNNIKKHAEASNVVIRLVASHPDIILRIEDNGRGFAVRDRLAAALNEKRMGFRSIEERVNLLCGTIKVQSRPMEGTKILIVIPYREENNDSKEKNCNC